MTAITHHKHLSLAQRNALAGARAQDDGTVTIVGATATVRVLSRNGLVASYKPAYNGSIGRLSSTGIAMVRKLEEGSGLPDDAELATRVADHARKSRQHDNRRGDLRPIETINSELLGPDIQQAEDGSTIQRMSEAAGDLREAIDREDISDIREYASELLEVVEGLLSALRDWNHND